MKILIVCCNCPNSPQPVEMAIKKALRKLGIHAEISCLDLLTTGDESAELLLGVRDIIEDQQDGVSGGEPDADHPLPYLQTEPCFAASPRSRRNKTLLTTLHALAQRICITRRRTPAMPSTGLSRNGG